MLPQGGRTTASAGVIPGPISQLPLQHRYSRKHARNTVQCCVSKCHLKGDKVLPVSTGRRRKKNWLYTDETTSLDEKSLSSYSSGVLSVDVSHEMAAVNRDLEAIIRKCDHYCSAKPHCSKYSKQREEDWVLGREEVVRGSRPCVRRTPRWRDVLARYTLVRLPRHSHDTACIPSQHTHSTRMESSRSKSNPVEGSESKKMFHEKAVNTDTSSFDLGGPQQLGWTDTTLLEPIPPPPAIPRSRPPPSRNPPPSLLDGTGDARERPVRTSVLLDRDMGLALSTSAPSPQPLHSRREELKEMGAGETTRQSHSFLSQVISQMVKVRSRTESSPSTSPNSRKVDVEKVDTSLCIEIIRRLTELMMSAEKPAEQKEKLSSHFTELRELRTEHLRNIEREIKRIEDLDEYLVSVATKQATSQAQTY